jgi:hypothetical protein
MQCLVDQRLYERGWIMAADYYNVVIKIIKRSKGLFRQKQEVTDVKQQR